MTCWLGQTGEVEGSWGRTKRITRPSLYISLALFIAFSSLPWRNSESSIQAIFGFPSVWAAKKIYPLLRGKLPTLPLQAGPTCSPLKAPNLSNRPILFLSPGPFVILYRGSSRRPADGRQLMQPNIRRPISTCLPDMLGAHPNALE